MALLGSYNTGMEQTTAEKPVVDAAREWPSIVAPYKEANAFKALNHLLTALALLALTAFLMVKCLDHRFGWIPMLLLSVPAGALIVKLFAIQHDAGHGALFNQKWANDLVGGLLSFLVLTPYRQWAREHAKHHATSGNLEFRGIGDVDTWTVKEFKAATGWQRFWYRVYRNPLFLFGPGALGYFFFKQRFVWYNPRRLESWVSVWSTNLAITAFVIGMCRWIGTGAFFAIYVPSFWVGSAFGTWIFYVGHQFDDSYFAPDKDWDFFDASMKGASFYDMPWIFHYLTCNIGFHHIHHLCSKIPFYNLPKCHKENAAFHVVPIRMWESFSFGTLALWDEQAKKMVRFSEVA